MPPWGRPPGARPGRKNDRIWELRQQQQRSWEYDARVEELDTDDDNSPQGVELDQGYGQARFRSDELLFTGIDLGGIRRRRSGETYDDDFTPSDDEDDFQPSAGLIRRPDMQTMYKEKEEMLVERALERIARARALGKPNVKLTRAEIDALERIERSQNPPRPSAAPTTAPKGKKEAPIRRKPVEVRKKPSGTSSKSASDSPKRKPVDSRSRGRSVATSSGRESESRDNSVTSYALPPAEPEYGRRLPYAQGYYVTGPPQLESSRQGSRTSSNPSLHQLQQMQQMATYQHPYHSARYASNPDVAYGPRPGSNPARGQRPDPSEPDWEPRSRSSSSLVNIPLDQLPYQTSTPRAPRFDPSDPRFASPQRRVVSGPPATNHNQPVQYRRPQDELFIPDEQPEVYSYLAPSDPEEEEDDDDDDDDDADSDYGEGVQVDVSERSGGSYAIQTRSATASASTQKKKTIGKKSAGKGKKGR